MFSFGLGSYHGPNYPLPVPSHGRSWLCEKVWNATPFKVLSSLAFLYEKKYESMKRQAADICDISLSVLQEFQS